MINKQNAAKEKVTTKMNIFSRKLQCVTVCHTIYAFVHKIYPSVHRFLLANVHCNETLACFKDTGFSYSIYSGSLQGLLPDNLLLSCVLEILQL